METTNCNIHGEQEITLVCRHIAQAADTSNIVGFLWSQEDDQIFPDAWCKKCNTKLLEIDAWTKEMLEYASFKVICSKCYQDLRKQQINEKAL
jgi:hypothetical protein